jgi:hypothetical protein
MTPSNKALQPTAAPLCVRASRENSNAPRALHHRRWRLWLSLGR